MEIRVLQYFLETAKEQTISGAAQKLHLTQPTLSRQLKELEESLGKQLFIRGSRKITLTEEGILLRKRAEQITELMQRTENEIMHSDDVLSGDIYFGAGETDAIRILAASARHIRNNYPDVHFHIYSGDTEDVLDKLDKGLLDFGLIFTPVDVDKYDYIKMPVVDEWGVLMRKDLPLAQKESIRPADLWDKPLMVSREFSEKSDIAKWLGKKPEELNISGTYNLVFNGSVMADEGLGYVLTFRKLINVTGETTLCFRLLEPPLYAPMYLIWKKYQPITKSAAKFLEIFKEDIGKSEN